jgi:hypothetical protein
MLLMMMIDGLLLRPDQGRLELVLKMTFLTFSTELSSCTDRRPCRCDDRRAGTVALPDLSENDDKQEKASLLRVLARCGV